MGRTIAITLILTIAALSLIGIQNAYAETPQPTTPQFSLKIVAYPYDVPPVTSTTTDPYTGKQNTVTIQEGFHVENRSIQITITNQPFSYAYNGTSYHIYYSIRVKGHFENDWKQLYGIYSGYSYVEQGTFNGIQANYTNGYLQSDSQYTVIPIPTTNYPKEGQLDIQASAVIGHDSQKFVSDAHLMDLTFHGGYDSAVAADTNSDWSSTQTINLDAIPQFTSEYIILVAGFIIIAVLAVALVLSRRKRA